MPPLRPTQSFSNLQAYGLTAPSTPLPIPPLPTQSTLASEIQSSASSALSIEGILISDAPDVEETDADARGRLLVPGADEESKLALRQHLRQTLKSREPSFSGPRSAAPRLPRPAIDMEEISRRIVDPFPPRQYFVLTEAGKPVFASRAGTDREVDGDGVPDLTAMTGVAQALISIFLADGDKLRAISSGRTRITFLLRPPLYYACASSWGEPESVTRAHLEYLHLQILSVVSLGQLRRIFERRNNFDLRRLLDGAEPLLHGLLARVDEDVAMSFSALHVLKLDHAVRKRAADCLLPPAKIKPDILYVILVADGRIVTLSRPKKHSIHPSDLHILLNTTHSPAILRGGAAASWLPVCLPKFNPAGFVNAYVSFIEGEDKDAKSGGPPDDTASVTSESADAASLASGSGVSAASESGAVDVERELERRRRGDFETSSGIALVCVSAGSEFDAIRGWCEAVVERMTDEGVVAHIAKVRGRAYTVGELGIPGLRHFVYKSRAHVQVTVPVYEDPYDSQEERRRLVTLYQVVHDNIHARSGQKGPLKLQYLRTEREAVMGWITQPFELYVAMSPLLPKSAVVGAANAVARWVKREEAKLFLRDAPVF